MADTPGYGESPDFGSMDPRTNGHGANGTGVIATAKENVRGRAQEMKDTAMEKTAEKASEIKNRIQQVAGERTARTGVRVSAVARAIRTASEELRLEGEEKLAGMTDDAASHVERIGSYLSSENPSGMMHDLEQVAKKNPALFLGATFAVGLVAGRFLRSSQPAPAPTQMVEGGGEETS